MKIHTKIEKIPTFVLLTVWMVVAVLSSSLMLNLNSSRLMLQPLFGRISIFMLGEGKKFVSLETERFELPDSVYTPDLQFKNERHFIEFLIRNDWIQRQVGIKMFPSTGFFPDIHGEIYDYSGDKIKVEIEFRAENYILHGHPFGGCDLILSFVRNLNTRIIRGVPVWSFYKGDLKDKFWDLCLPDDINTDFDKLSDRISYTQKSKKKAIGECPICGDFIFNKYLTYCSNECAKIATSI